jgi:hypothetical protein
LVDEIGSVFGPQKGAARRPAKSSNANSALPFGLLRKELGNVAVEKSNRSAPLDS